MFLGSVWTEIKGKQVLVAMEPSCSMTLENLLLLSNEEQVTEFFDAILERYTLLPSWRYHSERSGLTFLYLSSVYDLMTHRFGSHVIQTLFSIVAQTVERFEKASNPLCNLVLIHNFCSNILMLSASCSVWKTKWGETSAWNEISGYMRQAQGCLALCTFWPICITYSPPRYSCACRKARDRYYLESKTEEIPQGPSSCGVSHTCYGINVSCAIVVWWCTAGTIKCPHWIAKSSCRPDAELPCRRQSSTSATFILPTWYWQRSNNSWPDYFQHSFPRWRGQDYIAGGRPSRKSWSICRNADQGSDRIASDGNYYASCIQRNLLQNFHNLL